MLLKLLIALRTDYPIRGTYPYHASDPRPGTGGVGRCEPRNFAAEGNILRDMQLWPAPSPDRPVSAELTIPGSKSLTNRALVLAALADGDSTIDNPLNSRDSRLMIDGLRELGAGIGTRESSGADTTASVRISPLERTDGGHRTVQCGLAGTVMRFLAPVAAIAGGILVYAFADRGFRTSPTHVIAGIGIGICVTAGWFLTALTFDEFADNPSLASLSYVRPAGDSLDYLMRFTADKVPSFAVVTTIGALLGAFLMSVATKKFHFATFSDSGDTLRNMGGAVLMGIGGVTALGCTVGQAVTGVSTLALGSFVTFAAIVAGGFVGMKAMERFV